MVRRGLSILMCFVWLFNLVPIAAFAAPLETNFAEGKSYQLSNSNYTSSFGNKDTIATDGNVYSNSYINVSETITEPVSITVDLKAVYSINKIKVWHYWKDGRKYHGTKTEVSEDGTNWVTIFDAASQGEYEETEYGKMHVFDTKKVRYIRDWANGSSVNGNNHWVEIQAFGPAQTGTDAKVSLPIFEEFETMPVIDLINGTANLVQDKVQGKYALKVTVGDDPRQSRVAFSLAKTALYNVNEYSQTELWVKPGPGAQNLKFYIRDAMSNRYQINSDQNSNGLFEVGQDLTSGQWNSLTLDLKKITNSNLVQVKDLIVETDEISTWFFDQAKSVKTPTVSIDLSKMVNAQTRQNNGGIEFIPNGVSALPNTFNVTPSILTSDNGTFSTDILENTIKGISINSDYRTVTGPTGFINLKRLLVPDQATRLTISGDGTKLYYVVSGRLYLINLLTGEKKQVSTYEVIGGLYVSYDGNIVGFPGLNNGKSETYVYDNLTGVVKRSDGYTTGYAYSAVNISPNGTIVLHNDYRDTICIFEPSATYASAIKGGIPNITSICVADTKKVFYIVNNELHKLTKTVTGSWSDEKLSGPTVTMNKILCSPDGLTVYIKAGSELYVFNDVNKVLKKASVTVNEMEKVINNSELVLIDSTGAFKRYNLNTDTATQFTRPTDYKDLDNMYYSSVAFDDADFTITDDGSKLAYVSSAGLNTLLVSKVMRPERYLFSFDGKNTWFTYKNGVWSQVRAGITPVKDDFINYGLTVDEVNKISEAAFATLYVGGRELYNIDVAVYFNSIDMYTTPSLKSITVNLQNSQDAGVETLFSFKKQDFNSAKWRQIKKVYPVELQPKQAETYYMITADGQNYMAFKNGQWNTIDSAYLQNLEGNWINITQNAMTIDELRSVPEDYWNTLLPSNSFAVAYITRAEDTSTAGYTSQITVDYVESKFESANLVLKVTLMDGSVKEYSGLTKTEVEDFMNWLGQRQFGKGPIFYCIKTPSTTPGTIQLNQYINYYSVLAIDVNEME